jgi:hypothetical protein
MKQIQKECHFNHARFILCLIPSKVQADSNYTEKQAKLYHLNEDKFDWHLPQKTITQFCKKEGIACIDLMPGFSERKLDNPAYYELDCHWNKTGHRIAAEEIYAYFKKQGLGCWDDVRP